MFQENAWKQVEYCTKPVGRPSRHAHFGKGQDTQKTHCTKRGSSMTFQHGHRVLNSARGSAFVL